MLQSRSAVRREAFERKEDEGNAPAGGCRKVAIFLDGTGNELGAKCSWLPRQLCETNIAVLYRLASEIAPSQQLAYYEPGVASSGHPDDDYNFGVGTKKHMLNAYNWLSDNYRDCDEVMLFGFSRGALSGRMLQGMLNRVGLAKKGHAVAATAAHFGDDAHAAVAFKASDKAWPAVRVKFFGMFDGVMRTLLHPTEHRDIARYHLQLTPLVDTFVHAISLAEYREIFDVHELYTAPSTNATQAWFMGVHADVGGGYPNRALANIAGGWVADHAAAAGLLLPPGWRQRPEMAVDHMADASSEHGLDGRGTSLFGIELERTFQIATVRDPARCRAEMGKAQQRILVHRSVEDRMRDNSGWVPLQWCCSKAKKAMDAVGYDFVASEHYAVAKAARPQEPAWIRLSFRWLRNAELSEGTYSNPEYYLKATNWHEESSQPPPPSAGASGGCCTALTAHPRSRPRVRNVGRWWWPRYKADQDFGGVELVLPYEGTAADRVMVELHEEDWVTDHDYLGRGYLKYSELGAWRTLSLGGGATLEAKAEPIASDAQAAPAMGSDYAQCSWMDTSTGLARSAMCESSGVELNLLFPSGAGNPRDCASVVEDTKTGAL